MRQIYQFTNYYYLYEILSIIKCKESWYHNNILNIIKDKITPIEV